MHLEGRRTSPRAIVFPMLLLTKARSFITLRSIQDDVERSSLLLPGCLPIQFILLILSKTPTSLP